METVNLFALQTTKLVEEHLKHPHTATAEDLVHLSRVVIQTNIDAVNSTQVNQLLDLAGNKAYESDETESRKWLKQVNQLREDYFLRNSPLHKQTEAA